MTVDGNKLALTEVRADGSDGSTLNLTYKIDGGKLILNNGSSDEVWNPGLAGTQGNAGTGGQGAIAPDPDSPFYLAAREKVSLVESPESSLLVDLSPGTISLSYGPEPTRTFEFKSTRNPHGWYSLDQSDDELTYTLICPANEQQAYDSRAGICALFHDGDKWFVLTDNNHNEGAITYAAFSPDSSYTLSYDNFDRVVRTLSDGQPFELSPDKEGSGFGFFGIERNSDANEGDQVLAGVMIDNGYLDPNDPSEWENHARIKTVEVVGYGKGDADLFDRKLELDDTAQLVRIDFDAIEILSWVTIAVLDTYPGSNEDAAPAVTGIVAILRPKGGK